MLSEFQHKWNGYLGGIWAARLWSGLTSRLEPSVHSAPHLNWTRSREPEKHHMGKMWEMDAIELARTEMYPLIIFVPKKDGTLRIFVYYCTLSAVTIRVPYPILGMVECIQSLGVATIFYRQDSIRSSWRVEVANVDCYKIFFQSHHGSLLFILMTFVLKCTPEVQVRDGHYTILSYGVDYTGLCLWYHHILWNPIWPCRPNTTRLYYMDRSWVAVKLESASSLVAAYIIFAVSSKQDALKKA